MSSFLGIETPTIYRPLKWEAAVPGQWRIVTRVKYDDLWKNDIRILKDFVAVFDLANLEVLHLRFPNEEKAPPLRVNVRRAGVHLPKKIPASPDPKRPFQIAFQVLCKIQGIEVNPVYELLGSSLVLRNAMTELYDSFLAQKDAHPGELPVVKQMGYTDFHTNNGVVAQPILKITGWQKRPEDLPDVVISEQRGYSHDGNADTEAQKDWNNIPVVTEIEDESEQIPF